MAIFSSQTEALIYLLFKAELSCELIIIIADDVSAAVPSCTPHLLDSSKIDADWSVFTKGD